MKNIIFPFLIHSTKREKGNKTLQVREVNDRPTQAIWYKIA